MNLHEIEKRCRFYRRTKMVEREKQLLKAVLLNPDKNPDWAWGIQRMIELDSDFKPLNDEFNFEIEPDVMPRAREEIAKLSFQYQDEWRFEREKRLIEHALKLFPDWKYLHDRMEWHSRPIFHRDPEKSKTQPRKPLHLPRNPKYIPKQETVDSMCFVTGTSSNGPYFDLCVQLIESIKATRFYSHVPIKVLDCGLTKEDADYLIKRFGCEIKDPGWDIDPIHIIETSVYHKIPKNAWKGCTARPYISKHFPGFNYYFWFDTDLWIQNDLIIDYFLHISNNKEFCAFSDPNNDKLPHHFVPTLPGEDQYLVYDKKFLMNDFFCISKNLLSKWQKYVEKILIQKKQYLWGTDMSSLTYIFYKEVNDTLMDSSHMRIYQNGAFINKDLNLLDASYRVLDIISLFYTNKFLPYNLLFDNSSKSNNLNALQTSKEIAKQKYADEKSHQLSLSKNYIKGNYFYRVYDRAENRYGSIERVLK